MKTQFEFTLAEAKGVSVTNTMTGYCYVSHETLSLRKVISNIKIRDFVKLYNFLRKSNDNEFLIEIEFIDDMEFKVVKTKTLTREEVESELKEGMDYIREMIDNE